jgi:hypothetical protein
MLPTYGVIGLAGRIGTGGIKKTALLIILMAVYLILMTAIFLFFLNH